MGAEFIQWRSNTLLELVNGSTKVAEIDFAAGTIWCNGTLYAGSTKSTRAKVTNAASGNFDTIDFSSHTPSSHPINLEGLTLADNTNAIRGASINPTRASGWISFTGVVTDTPAQVYTDFRQLQTNGDAEVLGFGSFCDMLSGASCASLFSGQDIVTVNSGATVLTAGGVPGVGIFGRFIKVLLDGETFNSGGVAANLFLGFQANVTDVQKEDTSFINAEVASGGLQNFVKFQCTAAEGATYLFNFTDDNGEPVSASNGTDLADISATANAGWIKIKVGSSDKYIPLYDKKAS